MPCRPVNYIHDIAGSSTWHASNKDAHRFKVRFENMLIWETCDDAPGHTLVTNLVRAVCNGLTAVLAALLVTLAQ